MLCPSGSSEDEMGCPWARSTVLAAEGKSSQEALDVAPAQAVIDAKGQARFYRV